MLHGLSALRHWLQAKLPLAHVAVGAQAGPSLAADLFLELAEQWSEGRQPTLDQLCREMAYPRAQLAVQLAVMARAGLLVGPVSSSDTVATAATTDVAPDVAPDLALRLMSDGAGAQPWRPTPAFECLVADYERELQARFIPREPLRNEQLFVDCQDTALAAEVRLLYDRCFDLGWLYLHRYGATCLMMATVLQALAVRRGHHAEVLVGHAEVWHQGKAFLLGRVGDTQNGRIDAHACCVLDGRLVLDFGLGNLRRHYRNGFYWGLATDRMAAPPLLAQVDLPTGEVVRWVREGSAPADAVLAEAARSRELLPSLLHAWDQRYPLA